MVDAKAVPSTILAVVAIDASGPLGVEPAVVVVSIRFDSVVEMVSLVVSLGAIVLGKGRLVLVLVVLSIVVLATSLPWPSWLVGDAVDREAGVHSAATRMDTVSLVLAFSLGVPMSEMLITST